MTREDTWRRETERLFAERITAKLGASWETPIIAIEIGQAMQEQEQRTLTRMAEGGARCSVLLGELVAMVRGECPSLLDEDSGGDARLSLAIDAALTRDKETD